MSLKLVVFLFTLVLTSAFPLYATETSKIEQDTAWFKEKLELSEDQTRQVRAVLQEIEKKVQKEHTLYKGSLRARMFMDKNIQELISKKFKTILTEEQFSEYQSLRKNDDDFLKSHLHELETELSLTDEQLKQIVPILESNKEKIRKLQNEYSEPHPAYMRKIQKIMAKQAKQIDEILSEDQRTKFRELRKMKEEEMRRKHPRPGDKRS